MTVSAKLAPRLALLNTLRATVGKPALADWKASAADLEQRIADLTPTIRQPAPTTEGTPAVDLAAAIAASEVAVTKVPNAAVDKNAKRRAVIEQIANKSVANDEPTTVIDAKAAARQLRNVAKKAAAKTTPTGKAIAKAKKNTPKAAAKAKSTSKKSAAAPKSTNDFGAYLAQHGLDAKITRAKLRRAGFSAPYDITNKKLLAALTSDNRKK